MPAGMPKHLLQAEWWADTYGWTPDQVGDLPLEALEWFPVIRQARQQAANLHASKNTPRVPRR